MNCVDILLETFHADKSELAGSTLPGRHCVKMMVLTLQMEDVL